jgi:hypothetical protein
LPFEIGDGEALGEPRAVLAHAPPVQRQANFDQQTSVKRGCHMHYGVHGNATLGRPIRHADGASDWRR